jgi:pyruvate formate lyase activating enzyme
MTASRIEDGGAAPSPATGELTATVFDIQSFSLNDGPGIRTTVFLKGCPLRCVWCHNPESIARRPQLMVNPALCVDCGACVGACPVGAHSMPSGRHQMDFTRCAARGECVAVCGYEALVLLGREYTVEGLWERLAPDVGYWRVADVAEAGHPGGVTFSGGEPMLQAPFIKRFAQAAPEPVDLAVETSGWAPWRAFEGLLPVVDLWLFDYKVTDPGLHQRMVGKDKDLILANLGRLCGAGAEVVLRLPIIPGVNDTLEHFRAVAGLLARYPQIRRAEIMGYHKFGEDKRGRLGLPPQAYTGPNATTEQKQSWLDQLSALGAANVTCG